MAEWRFMHGWSEPELRARLNALQHVDRNFDPAITSGWSAHRSTAIVAHEMPGPPQRGGAFERLCVAVADYEFSDPAIVTAHFDPDAPLDNRRILLELKVLGLRYLCAAVVMRVRREEDAAMSYFGFRYDTLQGHIERGEEWFLLRKVHATGDVRFEISARWRAGDFPNWWSRLGFAGLGQHYQQQWHMHAHRRLAFLAGTPEHTIERDRFGRRRLLAHEGPTIEFSSGAVPDPPAIVTTDSP